MRLGAAALATLCLVLGLVPMLVLPAIERAAASAGRVSATSATGDGSHCTCSDYAVS